MRKIYHAAIGYIRVSTKGQAKEDKFGKEAQKAAIEKYAEENGYTIIEWVEDEISGVKDDRPGFNSLLYGDVKNPPFEAIIVYKSDRVARETKLYFYYLYLLEKKGVKLLSCIEDYDSMGEFANVMRAIFVFIAEQERNNINLRTKGGRKAKANNGGFAGGRSPYGYTVVDGKLIINDEEAAVVKRIFAERESGKSFRGIAKDLSDDGILCSSGTPMTESTVRYILSNEMLYKGWYAYKGNGDMLVRGEQKPILDDEN